MQNIPNIKFRLRVYYKKTGVLAYLSHLEVVRTLEMIIRRSGLPYCVTQGFSPHMKISFGPALGVGIESENQIFDIYLKSYINDTQALCALKQASKESLEVIFCEYIDNSMPAASAIFGKTNYSVTIQGSINNIKVPDKITIHKKGKEKTLNVKDFLVEDISVEQCGENSKLNFCLESKSSGSCKPEIFITQLLDYSGFKNFHIINFKII